MKIKVRHYDYETGKERIEEEEIREIIKNLDEMATKSYLQGMIDASRMYNWGITLLERVLEEENEVD